jgi:hypothetical protein
MYCADFSFMQYTGVTLVYSCLVLHCVDVTAFITLVSQLFIEEWITSSPLYSHSFVSISLLILSVYFGNRFLLQKVNADAILLHIKRFPLCTHTDNIWEFPPSLTSRKWSFWFFANLRSENSYWCDSSLYFSYCEQGWKSFPVSNSWFNFFFCERFLSFTYFFYWGIYLFSFHTLKLTI